MSGLEAFFDDEYFISPDLIEKIRRRRCQMLIHSYLYYVLDETLIPDETWQSWANELVELQKNHHKIKFYDDAFEGWTGDTGAFLPKDEWVTNMAERLLKLNEKS